MDVSPSVGRIAKDRGGEHIVVAAAPHLPFRSNSFDVAISMGNSLGMCGGYDITSMFLTAIRNIVCNSGLLIATLLDPSKTTEEVHLKYHERNRRRGRPIGLVTIRFEYGKEKGDWFEWYHITPREIQKLCPETGWRIRNILTFNSDYAIITQK
jgi:ubiquinone/menaquinone biosynthesis C-methylase UbiE